MAADSTLLLSLVEEFVSGLQDSKAKDTATCKYVFLIFASTLFPEHLVAKNTPSKLCGAAASRMRNTAWMVNELT